MMPLRDCSRNYFGGEDLMHAVQTFHSLFYYEDVRQFSLTFLSKLNYLDTKVRLCRLTGDSISIGCLSRMLLLHKLMN